MRLSFRLREGMCLFPVFHMLFPRLLLVFSRVSFWLLLSMERFLYRSPLRELSRDPLFRLCGVLSVPLLKRPEKFVGNGSVVCQELVSQLIHTSGAAAGCADGVLFLYFQVRLQIECFYQSMFSVFRFQFSQFPSENRIV